MRAADLESRIFAASAIAIVILIAGGCSSTPQGTIAITLGGETDTLSRAPAPTWLQVDAIDATSGAVTSLGHVALPTSSLDLGDQSQTTAAMIRVTGQDAAGVTRVLGQTLPIELGALDGLILPLFVQRTGELARLPSPLTDAREAPVVAVVGGRDLLIAGGSDSALASATQIYDFGTLSAFASPPTLPRAPKSLAVSGTLALLIDDQGATWFDLSNASAAPAVAVAPPGGSFAEVSGGATILGPNGSSYVVGATRLTGSPTARVLSVDAQGSLAFLALSAPRLGAAAAWIENRGLVVAGGAAMGAGVEIVGPGATNGVPLSFPSDPVTGAGAAALDGSRVLLAGGVDSTNGGADAKLRVVDVGCSAPCAATVWPPTLATTLVRADAFAIDGATAFVVGQDASGTTFAARVSSTSADDVPLKVPRKNARAIALPIGSIGIVGGAQAIESFFP